MRDGISEIRDELPLIMKVIGRTARWVHPETFRALPVWCPDTARGFDVYDARWSRIVVNRKGVQKKEQNIRAAAALCEALGVSKPRPRNWTVCHIWGFDDDKFATKSRVVQDPLYYSCVGNMVLLPTPLKGFTDAVAEVKTCLRVCAFHLYGWICEHEDHAAGARSILAGELPDIYPENWPAANRHVLPLGTAAYDEVVRNSVQKRKAKIFQQLADDSLVHYPRQTVQNVLAFWKVLPDS